jgi:hypothetical protein
VNFFDWPLSRLLGLQVSANHTFGSGDRAGSVHGDLMLTNETDFPMPPADDYSLSAIVGLNLLKIVDLGAGVQLMNFLSVNKALVTPHDTTQNQYFPEGSHVKPDDRSDTVSGREFYSSAGTKLMGRVSIDPKMLFPCSILGKEDLKFYAEAAVLGLKDYTLYQNDTTWHAIPLEKRIPLMVGFNLPAFKVLDLLSVEMEYYQCPYSMEVWPVLLSGLPSGRDQLISRAGMYNPSDWRNDDIKWSVWAQRSFHNFFTVKLMVARDHDFMYSYSNRVIRQTITKKEDWQWNIKFLFTF